MNHNIKFVTPSSIYSFNLETIMDGLPDTLDLFQFSQSPKYLFLGLFEFNSSLILSISSSSFPISISNSTDLYRSLKSLSWFLNTSFNLFWVSLYSCIPTGVTFHQSAYFAIILNIFLFHSFTWELSVKLPIHIGGCGFCNGFGKTRGLRIL